MSVFEDLIDELKNENLLESTVIDRERADAAALPGGRGNDGSSGSLSSEGEADTDEPTAEFADGAELVEEDIPQIEKPASEDEFYRKRAMDEVASLQMVDHVLSGVEREHMKVAPAPFDDLEAKKALHKFLQVAADLDSYEYVEAELALRVETEAWSYALIDRDQKISVANVRRFCENSRPVLSSQALIALARFYRNAPFTEDIRGKFDFVMTRLFAREGEDGWRHLLFEGDEMIGHIRTLYGNWSSIALYTKEDDQIEVSLAITRFQEFGAEVEKAGSFDELLSSDLFNRARNFKESLAEMFYVPEVLAAAITFNAAVGNRFFDLILVEKQNHSVEKIEEKYGAAHDDLVSMVAGKTFSLSEAARFEPSVEAETPVPESEVHAQPVAEPKKKRSIDDAEDSAFDIFGVNKWLLIVCVVCIVLSGGVYIWAEKFAGSDTTNEVVATPVEISDPEIRKFVRQPRTARDTFYAVTEPTYDTLSEEEQKELLVKIQKIATSMGLTKVNLLNNKGRSVAYASKQRLELVSQ
ncbi:MAG: hypothetical protein IPM25_01670 [Chloracidobacterium sp.]|nr:hypothetical protein [Chloracidobacterium sp.]